MNKELIKVLAEEACRQTQLMMIMEYKNFESALYENFARLVIEECCRLCDDKAVEISEKRRAAYDFSIKNVLVYGESTAENLSFDIKQHFGIVSSIEEVGVLNREDSNALSLIGLVPKEMRRDMWDRYVKNLQMSDVVRRFIETKLESEDNHDES